jgi:hypothetical protein
LKRLTSWHWGKKQEKQPYLKRNEPRASNSAHSSLTTFHIFVGGHHDHRSKKTKRRYW